MASPINLLPPELVYRLLQLASNPPTHKLFPAQQNRARLNLLLVTSQVCRSWRNPSQRLLRHRVVISDEATATLFMATIDSPSGRRVDHLELRNVNGVVAGDMINAVQGVRSLVVRSVGQLSLHALWSDNLQGSFIMDTSRILFSH